MGTATTLSFLFAIMLRATAYRFASEYPSNITTDDQLLIYKQEHPDPVGIITTNAGCPVTFEDVQAVNSDLMRNAYFLDTMGSFDRERIPLRVVHTKGAGAFGYFNVTCSLADICKAQVFNTVGKVTKVAVRFSLITQDAGGSDLAREPRGFSVKFYTEEGNFDLVGLSTEMFPLKDPILFPPFIHAFKRNPKTGVLDINAQWDYLTQRPESLNTFMRSFGDQGIPAGYRFMAGYGIHTFGLYNDKGEQFFVKYHLLPDAGFRYFTSAQASQITDPDYSIKDLYNAIANGYYPTWTLSVQIVSLEEVKNTKFDFFDITKLWPVKEYPLRPIGTLVLNQIPDNYFASIEQLVFNSGQLVPGMSGGMDNVYVARSFSYRDTTYNRLGKNFINIKVNRPLYSLNYNRDGAAPVLDNGEDSPNYFPNSFRKLGYV